MVKIKPLKTRVCQACGMTDLDVNLFGTPSFLNSRPVLKKPTTKLSSIVNLKAKKKPSKMSSLF